MDGRTSGRAIDCRYSFVVPIYDEEESLPALVDRLARLMGRLDGPAEVIFVNDGSRDRSAELLAAAHGADPRFKAVTLSRNFGHQIAITAGMDFARGDAVIVMDADLQDPPELVPAMIERWKEGYDVVYAVRTARQGESVFKRLTARVFYRLFGSLSSISIPPDAGDFRLVDRRALNAFTTMRERDRFVRGLFGWIGLRQIGVPYVRPARLTGDTKYPLAKMLRLAMNGIVAFSDAPLRLAIWLGAIVSFGALAYGGYVLLMWLTGVQLVAGWSSTIVFLSLLGGVNLIMTGITGIYVGHIHQEVKNRPLYIVDEVRGLDDATVPSRVFLARSTARDGFEGGAGGARVPHRGMAPEHPDGGSRSTDRSADDLVDIEE